jgi:hypothetical protein
MAASSSRVPRDDARMELCGAGLAFSRSGDPCLFTGFRRNRSRVGGRRECEVLEVRPSKSRPEQGLIKIRTTTLNQDDEAVLVHVLNLVVPRRKDTRQR